MMVADLWIISVASECTVNGDCLCKGSRLLVYLQEGRTRVGSILLVHTWTCLINCPHVNHLRYQEGVFCVCEMIMNERASNLCVSIEVGMLWSLVGNQ